MKTRKANLKTKNCRNKLPPMTAAISQCQRECFWRIVLEALECCPKPQVISALKWVILKWHLQSYRRPVYSCSRKEGLSSLPSESKKKQFWKGIMGPEFLFLSWDGGRDTDEGELTEDIKNSDYCFNVYRHYGFT